MTAYCGLNAQSNKAGLEVLLEEDALLAFCPFRTLLYRVDLHLRAAGDVGEEVKQVPDCEYEQVSSD